MTAAYAYQIGQRLACESWCLPRIRFNATPYLRRALEAGFDSFSVRRDIAELRAIAKARYFEERLRRAEFDGVFGKHLTRVPAEDSGSHKPARADSTSAPATNFAGARAGLNRLGDIVELSKFRRESQPLTIGLLEWLRGAQS